MTTQESKSPTLVLDQFEDSDWTALPEWVCEAAKEIGYTEELWDNDKEPAACDEDWKGLTDSQKDAAKRLGYTQQTWDEDDESSNSSNDDDEPATMVLDQYEDSDWKDLPEWVQEAAKEIGYTKKLWNRDKEPKSFETDWKDLTSSQQEAAKRLGYTEKSWNDDDDDESSSSDEDNETNAEPTNVVEDNEINVEPTNVLQKYEDEDWDDLPEWVQEAAEGIGYNKKRWDRDQEPAVCQKDWEDLTSSQQESAKRLGYTSASWDADSDDGHSVVAKKARMEEAPPRNPDIRLEDVHKHTKWTIYCIQLYTETKDYQFRVNEDTGMSMHANRPLKAEEFIIRSPVGPCLHEALFEPSQNGELSEERRGFAERFMEWQQTYMKENRVGAQNAQVQIKFEDFANASITSKEHRPMPRNECPVYDMQIFEHEIVIAEFVPPPSNPTYELPPQRRFDVLHYDEGLVGLDGEEGYDPYKMKRPPTLCGMEERSLELPGHFTNHASGASSTAFDFMRSKSVSFPDFVGGNKEGSDELPEWLATEMNAKKRAGEIVQFSHLTARRSMEAGTEITTDYSRWHWSNADMTYYSRRTPIGYFLGDANTKRWDWDELSPKIQRAAKILGYTKEMWEEKKTPPTFDKPWKKLSLQEQEAAINLTGHNANSWDGRRANMDDDCCASDSTSVCSLLDLDWNELSEEQRKAAALIGHTENTWNEGGDHEDVLGTDLYFYNIRPEFRDAMVILGYTEVKWEMDDDLEEEYRDGDPWFLCLCGDKYCHSSKEKGGFRGVKYFPFEEQCKLAPLCEPWVQQQFSWRLYQREQEGKLRKNENGNDEMLVG